MICKNMTRLKFLTFGDGPNDTRHLLDHGEAENWDICEIIVEEILPGITRSGNYRTEFNTSVSVR